MSEIPRMPEKAAILEKAIELFKADRVLKGLEPITPEEEELKEGNWFEKARAELMSGYKSQLEEYAAALESEAQSIRDELGIKPAPPTKDVRELMEEVDRISGKLSETRQKLREATAEIERLRAVKVIPIRAVAKAPPPSRREERVYRIVKDFEEKIDDQIIKYKHGETMKTTDLEWAESKIREGLFERTEVPPRLLPVLPTCPAHPTINLTEVVGMREFPWGTVDVPGELFLFQCPEDGAYYICEPRKACQIIRLDRLRIILARIVRPIAAAPPAAVSGVRAVPSPLVTMEEVRAAQEEIERHPRFEEYITTMAYSLETFRLLDPFSKRALYEGFREWLRRHPFRELKRFSS